MKKILFVNSSLSNGGSERVMSILANEFVNIGYDVSMVLVRNSDRENYLLNDKIKLKKFSYRYKRGLFKIIERLFKLRRFIKDNKYDVVVSFMHEINFAVLVSTIGLKIPIIVSERCDPSKINKISHWFDDIAYIRAKKIVLQTEQVKKLFPKYLQKKIIIIPNPVSNDLPCAYKGIRKNKIVSVGRLDEQKNFELLINSFKLISEKYPEYELFIYGEGYLRNKLEIQINNLKLRNKVFLPGYKSNVTELIKDAKIYVCSSNYEGISNSMLEALALGIPTISTDCPVGGSRMVIKNGINGILVSVNNLVEMYSAILKIIEDDVVAKKMSKESMKVKKSLNSRAIAKEWEKQL